MLQHPAAELRHDLVNRGRSEIHGRNDRENGGSCLCRKRHVAQVDTIERRLADAQHQRTTLLQAYVGGPVDQPGRKAVRDRRKRAHGAGQHHHAVAGITAAGDAGAHVVIAQQCDLAVVLASQGGQHGGASVEAKLFRDDAKCVVRHRELHLRHTAVCQEHAEQRPGKDGTTRACHSQRQVFRLFHGHSPIIASFLEHDRDLPQSMCVLSYERYFLGLLECR